MIQEIGDMTIEVKEDGVSLYGGLDISRDWQGLDTIREFKAAVDLIALTMEREAADGALPEAVTVRAPGVVTNPFQ